MSGAPSKNAQSYPASDDDDLGGTGGVETSETYAEDHQSSSNTDRHFDEIVGTLEEMLLDEEFTQLQTKFLDQYCHLFSASDENKLIYTETFNLYVTTIEKYINDYLSSRIQDFSMESFLNECELRGEEQLCGDVFDVLMSLSEFEVFKEMMVAQKEKEQWNQSAITGKHATGAASAAVAASSSSVATKKK